MFSLSLTNVNSTIRHSNTQHSGAIYTGRPLGALISTANASKKRIIEELDVKTQDNGKQILFM